MMRQSSCPDVASPPAPTQPHKTSTAPSESSIQISDCEGSSAKLQQGKQRTPNQPIEMDFTASTIDQRYECGRLIRAGKSASVYEAVDLTTGKRVAVKFSSNSAATRMHQEGALLQKVAGHPNIVELIAVHQSSQIASPSPHDMRGSALVFPLAASDLLDLVSSKGYSRVSMGTLRSLFGQIVEAVSHCHTRGVYHLDIKPENILCCTDIDQAGAISGVSLKLSDFGSAVCPPVAGSTNLRGVVGSLMYMAPEVYAGELFSGASADCWSCGVVLYTMVMRKLPFDKPSIECPKFRSLVTGTYEYPKALGTEIIELLKLCWKINPDERISCRKLREHRFLKQKPQG